MHCGPSSVLVRLGLVSAALMVLSSGARASQTLNDIGLYDGSSAPTAYITFTGAGGTYVDVYADPQTATNWTNPNGSLIALYCIDTIHENTLGSSYTVNQMTPPPTFSTTSSYTDAGNRVAWILANTGTTALSRGAAQLLIWDVIDENFGVNWSDPSTAGLEAAYNSLMSEMNSSYNPNFNYMGVVDFWAAVHSPNSIDNQDMADFVGAAPSSVALLASGILAFGGFYFVRRRREAALGSSLAC
jgi:hypothetical protein